jgi:hypothetical protein
MSVMGDDRVVKRCQDVAMPEVHVLAALRLDDLWLLDVVGI